ncbi:MAG: hypothetical protein Fur0010_12830 [Bdellovibrio sp.]
MNIPYDMSTKFNDDLKDEAVNPEDMKKGIAFLKEKLEEAKDDLELAKIYNMIGIYQRILSNFEDAEVSFSQAHTIFTNLKETVLLEGVNLRMAIMYQQMGDYNKSDSIFTRIIKEIEQNQNKALEHYHDFVLQHYGKSLFDQKRYQKALDLFLRAHAMRLLKGDVNLIQSTELAIKKTKEKLGV